MKESYFNSKRNFVQSYGIKKYRETIDYSFNTNTNNPMTLHANEFEAICDVQKPIILDDDVICFARYDDDKVRPYITHDQILSYYGDDKKSHDVLNNVCPNYEILFRYGLNGILNKINKKIEDGTGDIIFLKAAQKEVAALLRLSERYYQAAVKKNKTDLTNTLKNAPANPPTSLKETLQSLRFISASFYFAGNFQIGFGRMDQYLYPYYKKDIESGVITQDEALALIKEFFLALNRDTDLYPGVTIGDNGQSVVLGGVKADGTSAINELTYLIIEASRDLKLIDPKINLRVDKNTPDDLLALACELTKEGLGFPQYLNDEIVIPALVHYGYELEDARNYVVAACWEFIIPGRGLDVVNQGAVSFPYAVDKAQRLLREDDFTENQFDSLIKDSINTQISNVINRHNVAYLPAPIISIFFDGSLDGGKDVTEIAKYKNVGIHGAGIASAVDAYTRIQELINKNDWNEFLRLRSVVANNFVGHDDDYEQLIYFSHKTGNDDEITNKNIRKLFDYFYNACISNSTGTRKIRPGSGTAQFYVWLTRTSPQYDFLVEPRVKATFEGRKDGAALPSSLAPANEIKVNGVLSVLRTFSHINYSKIVNGGPITIEFSPSAITGEEGLQKLSSLIKYFVLLGNQELQLNILDINKLEEAMEHPERHRNLIVRVWGWSGYFCELPREFQEQIISRHRYSL